MNRKTLVVGGVLGIAFIALVGVAMIASAAGAEGDNLRGWGWSSTIGWVSLTRDNEYLAENQKGTINYGVYRDLTGQLSGYGWSSTIGWVTFAPNLEGKTPAAHLEGNRLVGWARACSVFASGCSGSLKSDFARGGWDGWISLSGTTNAGGAYGAEVNTNSWNGSKLAWGSLVTSWLGIKAGLTTGTTTPTALDAVCSAASAGTQTVAWSSAVSGGTSPYTYQWENLGGTPESATSSAVNVVYGTDLENVKVTATFSVRDSASSTITTTCSFDGDGGTTGSDTFTVQAEGNGVGDIESSDSPEFNFHYPSVREASDKWGHDPATVTARPDASSTVAWTSGSDCSEGSDRGAFGEPKTCSLNDARGKTIVANFSRSGSSGFDLQFVLSGRWRVADITDPANRFHCSSAVEIKAIGAPAGATVSAPTPWNSLPGNQYKAHISVNRAFPGSMSFVNDTLALSGASSQTFYVQACFEDWGEPELGSRPYDGFHAGAIVLEGRTAEGVLGPTLSIDLSYLQESSVEQ